MNLREITDRVYDGLEQNNFRTLGLQEEVMFDRPLIGVAAGDDPYFLFLKEHIGDFHWTPAEAFSLKYGEADPASLRVISMVFPQSARTKEAQKQAQVFPCDRWVVSRGEWEPMMREFSTKFVAELEAAGIPAVSIDLQPQWKREQSEHLGIASRWSHRHYAYAAGLGTFGLSDGFISEAGKAIRLTSYIVKADLPVTDRGDRGPYDWCLYYAKGTCGACIKRCPTGAISKEGHDKERCAGYEDVAVANYWPAHIERGSYIFGCGLCQSGVPCQNRKPV